MFMGEWFRIWFKIEISLYSLPVVLAAAIALKIISAGAPLHVLLFLAAFFISCCCSIFAVFQLMLYVLHNKSIKKLKLVAVFIACWFVIWSYAGIVNSSELSIYFVLGSLLPILVVLHLGYLARGSFKFNT